MTPKIYGFSGLKRAGKDYAARLWGEILYHYFDESVDYYAFSRPIVKTATDLGLIDEWKWHSARKYKEDNRYIVQEIGEFLKKYNPDIWVDFAERKYKESKADSFLITDVRFPVEATWIKRNGGVIFGINSPVIGDPIDPHISEAGLPNFYIDCHIYNDYTDNLGAKLLHSTLFETHKAWRK